VNRALAAASVLVAVLLLAPGTTPALEHDAGVALVGSESSFKAMDLEGGVHTIPRLGAKATVLVFIASECPISNGYTPDINALAKSHPGASVYAVLSEPGTTRAAALEHRKTWGLEVPVLFDATGDLASRFAPTHTPEAFVLGTDMRVAYRGRIDDAYAELGKKREVAGSHDLETALAAVLEKKAPPVARTTPVGCVFEGWEKDALPKALTYTRDVAPILDANCVACHHPNGIAPFSLATYEDAKKRSKTIVQTTETRYMPPWHAEPGFGHFADERRLSDREIQVLAAWAQSGAPEGDAANRPAPPVFTAGWKLGQPDMVLTLPKPFDIPATGKDIYRCFVLKAEVPDDMFVVATEFKAGAPSVVHHCLVYLDTTGSARRLEEKAGGYGYPSFGGPGFRPTGELGGWAPGAVPSFLPEGMGRPFKKGSDVVIQIHYHPNGKAEQDRSSFALYFAKKPVVEIVLAHMIQNSRIDIAPGETNYKRTADFTVPADVTIIGIIPHMHLIGREMKVTGTLPSGEVIPLIWVKDWEFKWQDQYQYAKPFVIPGGTVIHMEAIYDNSAANPNNPSSPPQRVKHGEQTTDEMCLCFFNYAVPNFMMLAPKPKKVFR
jgi:mono/diheme cytochrome c family protein